MAANIVETFERLADLTWKRLYHGQRLACTQSEETITDINLLDLKMLNVPEVSVIKGTKPQEAIYGFDWEWWIGSATTGWWRYAVQAKRLKLPDGSYKSLRHQVANTKVYQIDLLEAYAQQHNAIPLYCLYNCIEDIVEDVNDYSNYWHCPRPIDRYQLGCTVAPLDVVRSAFQSGASKKFTDMHQNKRVFPWRCLVAGCNHVSKIEIGIVGLNKFRSKAVSALAPPNWTGSRELELPPMFKEPQEDAIPLTESNWYHQTVVTDSYGETYHYSVLPKRIIILDTRGEGG